MSAASTPTLLQSLDARGDVPLLGFVDGSLTGEEVAARASVMARRFRSDGLESGEVVAIRGAQPSDAIHCLLALWSTGLVAFPVSDREPASVVDRLLADAGCRTVLPEGVDRLASEGYAGPLALPTGAATLVRTSGSSGHPKIAVHSLDNHLSSARAAAEWFELGPGDSWMLALPLHHVGGLAIVMRALVSGAAVAIPPTDARLADALISQRPTHVSLVPTQLYRLLAHSEAAAVLAGCKAVLVGGSPMPIALRLHALERGLRLVLSYGSTESTALVAAGGGGDLIRLRNSAGHVLGEHVVHASERGEILIGGPSLFLGYLESGSVRDPRGADGLYATGDLGHLDANGILFVTGRKDRMFISGGENVQPEEIEVALEEADGVLGAVVVAVPHPEFGQRPVAFVRCGPKAPTSDGLEVHLVARLPRFKVPDAFYRLPTGGNGTEKPDPARLVRLLEQPEMADRLEAL